MYEITRLDPVTLAGFLGLFGLVTAAVFGLPIIVLELRYQIGLGYGTYLVTVVSAAGFGVINGFLTALIYNSLATLVGGIKIDLDTPEATDTAGRAARDA